MRLVFFFNFVEFEAQICLFRTFFYLSCISTDWKNMYKKGFKSHIIINLKENLFLRLLKCVLPRRWVFQHNIIILFHFFVDGCQIEDNFVFIKCSYFGAKNEAGVLIKNCNSYRVQGAKPPEIFYILLKILFFRLS